MSVFDEDSRVEITLLNRIIEMITVIDDCIIKEMMAIFAVGSYIYIINIYLL